MRVCTQRYCRALERDPKERSFVFRVCRMLCRTSLVPKVPPERCYTRTVAKSMHVSKNPIPYSGVILLSTYNLGLYTYIETSTKRTTRLLRVFCEKNVYKRRTYIAVDNIALVFVG